MSSQNSFVQCAQHVTAITFSRLSNTTMWQNGEAMIECISFIGIQEIIYFLIILVVLMIFCLSNRTTNIVKDLTNIDYGYERSPGDIPPVYPNGWFVLVESRDLKEGQTKAVTALGHEFVVYRGEDKKAYVFDAYCPHLGAHLGVGGKVKGSCIQCPFHGWQFRGEDGSCVSVPNSSKAPTFAKLKKWTSCEVNCCVFVWHHAENEPPQWQIPQVPEIVSGEWTFKGRHQHTIRCHIQEIPENGADIAHFNHLHSSAVVASTDSKFWRGMKHSWISSWEPEPEPNVHMTTVTLNHVVSLFGIKIPMFECSLSIKQIGPAIVLLWLESYIGKGFSIQYIQPEGPLRQKVVHMIYTEEKILNLLGKLLLFAEVTMLERDVTVWNNKIYLKKPTLTKEDAFISKFRRWYSQFYSENSPTLKSIRDRTLEW